MVTKQVMARVTYPSANQIPAQTNQVMLAVRNHHLNRMLYSLRHPYAKLGKQMCGSAAMIERHYSKATVTMAAERLA